MTGYRFDEHTQSIIENTVVPIGVYQIVDGRVATLAASEGLCRLFGYKDLKEAIEMMDSNMYWNVHPDDVERVVAIAAGFVREENPYNLVCRVMVNDGYRIIHARGQHITTDTGERLAVVWYIDEGRVMPSANAAKCEKKTEELKASMLSLLNNMPALTFSKNVENGRYLACNQAFADFAHKKCPAEVIGLTDYDIFDKETADRFVANDRMALSMDEPYIFYENIPDGSGSCCRLRTAKQRYIDESGRSCLLGMCVDVTDTTVMCQNEALSEEETSRIEKERESINRHSVLSDDYLSVYTVDMLTGYFSADELSVLFENLGAPIRGDDFYAAAIEFCRKYVYPDDMDKFMTLFSRENVSRVLQDSGLFTLEFRIIIHSEPLYVCLKAAKSKSAEQQMIVGFVNIDAQKKLELQYESNSSSAWEKANKDALTSVRNKHSFDAYAEKLQEYIDMEDRPELAIGIFDCDSLRTINDDYGHDKGNLYLVESCRLICKVFAHSPVFRVGGDEFTVVLRGEDLQNIDDLLQEFMEKQSKISSSAKMPWEKVKVSFGIAVYCPHIDYSIHDLIRRADRMMYDNKHTGR